MGFGPIPVLPLEELNFKSQFDFNEQLNHIHALIANLGSEPQSRCSTRIKILQQELKDPRYSENLTMESIRVINRLLKSFGSCTGWDRIQIVRAFFYTTIPLFTNPSQSG